MKNLFLIVITLMILPAYANDTVLQGNITFDWATKSQLERDENISIVCGKVLEQSGYDNFHRGYLNSSWDRTLSKVNISIKSFENDYFYPDFTSYVGIVINREKMKEVGLVRKEYFIWQDDVEHTYRLGKSGRIIGLSKYENSDISFSSTFDISLVDEVNPTYV